MSHDKEPVLVLHQLPEGVCLYPGLHPGGLLHLLGLTAIILNLVGVLDHCLVTAPSQGHVYGCPGIFIILAVAVAVHTDTDT